MQVPARWLVFRCRRLGQQQRGCALGQQVGLYHPGRGGPTATTREKVNGMSGSTLAIVLIPIVVAVGLVVWISMVVHADRHPQQPARGGAPDREVTGGMFQGDRRHMTPRRDAQPREAAGLTGDPPPTSDRHQRGPAPITALDS
jgi:hypothetical protein